jgi:predicted double-glycine peptidase
MALHYLGIQREQAKLAQQLGVRPDIGAPASGIKRLATDAVSITYDAGEWETIQAQLAQKTPVIAMVQAGELPHWHGETFQHAVVIIACSETQVWLLDPATSSDPIIVSIDEFMLAWSEMDYQYAVVSVIGKEG